jgi:DNA-binding transcriptional LysR family regulator
LTNAEYKKQFPGVQLQVNRSYGSRVVEAVMENVADFGLTQLPVAEKRVQIVDIYRDEIRCVVPAEHPLATTPNLPEKIRPQPRVPPVNRPSNIFRSGGGGLRIGRDGCTRICQW